MFITNNHALFYLWWKEILVKFQKVFKYYVHDCNSKHYNNTAESIKLIREIIIPYIEKERISLKLLKTQPALLMEWNIQNLYAQKVFHMVQ